MSIQNRKVVCDICSNEQTEKLFGAGWPGWVKVEGIGAREPAKGAPINNENLEMYLCPAHKEVLSDFLSKLQNFSGVTL